MPTNRTRWFSRDADALRADLLIYARSNFADKISDFSPASLGGLLLELAAQVGDAFQYYADYGFAESQWDTATETENIERFLRDVGITPSGASPASAEVDFFVEVPNDPRFDGGRPLRSLLPVIRSGTILRANNGVPFVLVDDIDFSREDANGDLVAEIVRTNIGLEEGVEGAISSFIMRARGIVVSGQQETETFAIGAATPFKTITLSKGNVHEIVNVVDASGNQWLEVDNLSQDVAYTRRRNLGSDRRDVPTLLKTVRSSKRFIREFSLSNGFTSLRFGGGTNPATFDAEDFNVPFRLASVVPFVLDPGAIGKTRSFGESPGNTTLSVTFRHGGGTRHNVPEGSITSIDVLEVDFPLNVNSRAVNDVIDSVVVNNPRAASGGSPPLTAEEYRTLIPLARAAQARLVSQADLVARVISLPSEFGRVFRAAARPSLPGLPTRIWISCQRNGRVVSASPALKTNLKTYLGEFRLIGDAIDILDTPVLNWGVRLRVEAGVGFSKQAVIADIGRALRTFVREFGLQPDAPLPVERLRAAVLDVPGVERIQDFEILARTGRIDGLTYSDISWSVPRDSSVVSPPPGGIFEMLDPGVDISISAG